VKSCKDDDSGNVIFTDNIKCVATASCTTPPFYNKDGTKCIITSCYEDEGSSKPLASSGSI